jgi:hypothetical protein
MIEFHSPRLSLAWHWLGILCVCAFVGTMIAASSGPLGEVQHETDVGGPLRAGSAHYDAARGEYRITGGGDNMWGTTDAFHYVYRQASGDLTLTASVRFPTTGGNEHKKAGWMVRQRLTPNSPYADVVLHASGLASLQYRLTEGGETQEIQSKINMPQTLRLVRLGNSFSFWAARAGGPLELAGTVEVPLHDPVYAGLAVCSHDAKVLEEAVISKTKTGETAQWKAGWRSSPRTEASAASFTAPKSASRRLTGRGMESTCCLTAAGSFTPCRWRVESLDFWIPERRPAATTITAFRRMDSGSRSATRRAGIR